MRVVLTTVINASVTIDNKVYSQIDRGFCLLVGFTHSDDQKLVDKMIDKILSLRVFMDERGLTNLSIYDVKGQIMSVSQFTLYADTSGGRRPSFVNAMKPDQARELYAYVIFFMLCEEYCYFVNYNLKILKVYCKNRCFIIKLNCYSNF